MQEGGGRGGGHGSRAGARRGRPRPYRRAELRGGGRRVHSGGAAKGYIRGEEEGEAGRKVSA